MRTRDPQTPYQVYCYQCNVTAPVGTRRCLHCGGRLSGTRNSQQAALTDLFKSDFSEADEEGEELTTTVGSAAPKVVMWIVIVVGGFFYRLCN